MNKIVFQKKTLLKLNQNEGETWIKQTIKSVINNIQTCALREIGTNFTLFPKVKNEKNDKVIKWAIVFQNLDDLDKMDKFLERHSYQYDSKRNTEYE